MDPTHIYVCTCSCRTHVYFLTRNRPISTVLSTLLMEDLLFRLNFRVNHEAIGLFAPKHKHVLLSGEQGHYIMLRKQA